MLQTIQPENSGGERNQWAGLTGGSFLDKVGAQIWGQIQIQAGVRVRRTAGAERLCQSRRAWGLCCGQPPNLAGAAVSSLGFSFGTEKWFTRCPWGGCQIKFAWPACSMEAPIRSTKPELPEHSQVHPAGHLSAELICSRPPPLTESATSCSCPLTGGSGLHPCWDEWLRFMKVVAFSLTAHWNHLGDF